MVQQVGDDAAAMGAVEHLLALFPLPPSISENLFLFALSGAIVRVRLGHGDVERTLVIQLAPVHADKLAGLPDRSEALIVKVVDRAEVLEPIGVSIELLNVFFSDFSQANFEPVGLNVLGVEGAVDLPEVLDLHRTVREARFRTVSDREMLKRRGVPVLEPAVTDPSAFDIPVAQNLRNRFRSPQTGLREPIQGVRSTRWTDRGDLLDPKIFMRTFKLHRLENTLWRSKNNSKIGPRASSYPQKGDNPGLPQAHASI